MTALHKKALEELVDASKIALQALLQTLPEEALVYDYIPDISKKEAQPVKLYQVDSKVAKKLDALQTAHDAQLNLLDKSEKSYSWHNKVCNFVNPEQSTSSYSVHIVSKYKHINKSESVMEYLPGELARAINIEQKKLKERDNLNEAQLKAEQIALDERIKHAKKVVDEVLHSSTQYEVRISAKVRAYNYAEVRFNKMNKHLSDQKPNVIFFEKAVRANDHHTKFMRGAKHLIGDIYYKVRDDER